MQENNEGLEASRVNRCRGSVGTAWPHPAGIPYANCHQLTNTQSVFVFLNYTTTAVSHSHLMSHASI